jgi:hypothetical protein
MFFIKKEVVESPEALLAKLHYFEVYQLYNRLEAIGTNQSQPM